MEITLSYWYMFFVAAGVGTAAMSLGIGGAVFLGPILLLALRIPPSIALGIGLFVEIFGFTSGVIGFARARMINYQLALRVVAASVPFAVAGVLLGKLVPPSALQVIFGTAMLLLAGLMLFPGKKRIIKCEKYHETCQQVHGDEECFLMPNNPLGLMTAGSIGGAITGLISVGIGETNEYVFIRKLRIHSGVAAGTSVFIVALTAIVGAVTHGIHLASHTTPEEIGRILSIVMFCAPGAIVGAQIGVKVSGLISHRLAKILLTSVFLIIAVLTLLRFFLA